KDWADWLEGFAVAGTQEESAPSHSKSGTQRRAHPKSTKTSSAGRGDAARASTPR
ncbi:unnamed protein product, partial [Amoebophrya sp. A25]